MAELCANEEGHNKDPIFVPGRPREVKYATCSSNKARKILGYNTKYTLKDSIKKTAEYIKDHGGIDLVIERKYLNSTIGTLLSVMLKKYETQAKKETTNAITIDQSLQSAS